MIGIQNRYIIIQKKREKHVYFEENKTERLTEKAHDLKTKKKKTHRSVHGVKRRDKTKIE